MRNLVPRSLTVALALLALASCSTDTPTAPERVPAPPPGSGTSTAWNITVTAEPSSLVANAEQPATITVRVRRASDGSPPPGGTTTVVSAGLGEFNSAGSEAQTVVVTLSGGVAQLLYFAGALLGTDAIQAQLESSVGRALLEIVEAPVEVVASFEVVNPDGNRSVQFLNTSTGDPTKFRWEFGDGRTSSEENPEHIYDEGGVYVVRFTASKPGSSDTITQALTLADDPPPPGEVLFITSVAPNEGRPEGGTAVTIGGTGFTTPLRVLFGTKLGSVTAMSSTSITVVSPPGDMNSVACDSGGGAGSGSRAVDTSVSIVVELQSGESESAPGGFTYRVSLSPNPNFGDCI